MGGRNTRHSRGGRRGGVSELPGIVESGDGWFAFLLRGIGWVEVAMAKVDGLPEIVGLRMDVRPMFVDESELYVLDMTPEQQRQWAIDNTPHGAASPAWITPVRLPSLPPSHLLPPVPSRTAAQHPRATY